MTGFWNASQDRSSAAGRLFARAAKRLEAVEQRLLTGKDLLARLRQRKPCGAIDLREGLAAPAVRRPLDLELIAAQAVDLEVAFEGEGLDLFSAALADPAERPQRAGRSGAKLLG